MRTLPLAAAFLLCTLLAGGCGGGGREAEPEASGPPTVTEVAPSTVSSASATTLTIRGTDFQGTSGVDLRETATMASVALGGVVVLDSTRLTALVPTGMTPGTYDVRVTTPLGTNATSGRKLGVVAVPVVQGVTPPSGFNDRTTAVTITGGGFSGATGVALTDAAATPLTGVTVVGDAVLTAVVPAGVTAGTWGVRVTTPLGSNTTSAVGFTPRNLIDPDLPGAFFAGHEDGTINGASGDTPAARVYYPAMTAGPNAAPDSALAPYHAVVFTHAFKPPAFGGSIGHTTYGYLCERLASFGYVVISVDMAPNNKLFETGEQNARRDAADARAALTHLALRAATAGDRLFGVVNTTWAGIGGHSRGGDASLIACADEATLMGAGARFGAVFVLGSPSWDLLAGGSRIAFGDFTSVPCVAIGGTRDLIVPFADQQDIYAQAGSPSMVFEIIGGNHSQYTDSGRYLLGDGLPTVPLQTQQDICRRYVVSWLGFHVKGQVAFFAPYVLGGAIPGADVRLQSIAWK